MKIQKGDIVRVLAYGSKKPADNKENYWYVVEAMPMADGRIWLVNIAEAINMPEGRKLAPQVFSESLVIKVK